MAGGMGNERSHKRHSYWRCRSRPPEFQDQYARARAKCLPAQPPKGASADVIPSFKNGKWLVKD